jgi:acyl-CoA synthetase (NDP forming)
MLNSHPEIAQIIEHSRVNGWVLEPDAKHLFSLAGLDVPRYTLAKTLDEALHFAHEIGYPVVAKIVSPRILHKSDVGGVVVGITDHGHLVEVFQRFHDMDGFTGVLIEEMVSGIELIMGAKNDFQFGPMILLGMGGTGVEIYQDVSLRMAPLSPHDVPSMIKGLKAHKLLEGYRGEEPVDLDKLSSALMTFSSLVMEMEGWIESIDINPLLCSSIRCMVADARIILKG